MLAVRANGSVCMPVGLGLGDHLCWPYDDQDAFQEIMLRYEADGLMHGERVLCVIDAPERAALMSLDPAHLSISGTTGPAVVLHTVAEAYGCQQPRTPHQQLDFYAAAAERAQADGYTGLRVLAEVTRWRPRPAARPPS